MSKIILSERKVGNLNIKYSISKAEPCILNALIINGKPSSVFSFGRIRDVEADIPRKGFFGCSKRRFLPYTFIPESLLKEIGISRDDIPVINEFIKKIVDRDDCKFCFEKING